MIKTYREIRHDIVRTKQKQNPSEDEIIERTVLFGLCHWRKLQLIDKLDCKSVWRFAFSVEKVKATEYTGVKNR
jgi:hypothetical protein